LAELFAVWPQTAGATIRQHMQINNSFVILIPSPFLEIQIVFLDAFYSGESDTGWGGRYFRHSPAQRHPVSNSVEIPLAVSDRKCPFASVSASRGGQTRTKMLPGRIIDLRLRP
jgi:hypothetical protein